MDRAQIWKLRKIPIAVLNMTAFSEEEIAATGNKITFGIFSQSLLI